MVSIIDRHSGHRPLAKAQISITFNLSKKCPPNGSSVTLVSIIDRHAGKTRKKCFPNPQIKIKPSGDLL